MKAIFDGQDYIFILDKSINELQILRGEKLEARLINRSGETDLGKVAELELADNDGIDGIQLRYSPENAPDWEAVERVSVKINERAYGFVREGGRFGTRYNGSDKVEILNEDRF